MMVCAQLLTMLSLSMTAASFFASTPYIGLAFASVGLVLGLMATMVAFRWVR